MDMNCAVCEKFISGKEIKSIKEGTAFKFYDFLRDEEVAYHPECYQKKWGKPKDKIDYNFVPKNL